MNDPFSKGSTGLHGSEKNLSEKERYYHKQTEKERQAHLWFLESMDKVNQAIQGATDLEQMMSDVLDVMLSIFDCDRAWLVYPCDPNAASWQVPMERTKPEYIGANVLGLEVPMDEGVREVHKTQLASDGPVKYGPGTENPLPADNSVKFGYKCFISMAIYPKIGRPWQFGMHQCSYARQWTAQEERLFQEIGRRLEDALTTLLMYRNLQDSEARYRRIVETSNEGIWTIDKELMTSFVNARMAEIVGYRVEEMIGRSLTDFILEEEIFDHEKTMKKRCQGLPDHYERRFNHKNGHTVYTLVSAVPILDTQQNFEGAFAMVTDITERIQAEEALKESEAKYMDLYENAPDMYASVNVKTALIEACNITLANTLGYSKKEIIGRPVFEIYHPDCLEEVKNAFKLFVETGEIHDKELQLRKKDGSKIDVSLNASAVRGEDGRILFSRSTLRDITERKQVEEKMLRSDQRLRFHKEQSPLGFLEWDENFRAIEWNAACERIFGYTREEAIGRHANDLILPMEVHELVDGIYHSLMSHTGGQHSINENVTKDGRIIICEWFNTTLINKDGKAIGVASVCRDITEQKQMEVELAKYREHLEEQVKERTAELEIAKNKAQQYLDVAGVILVAIDADRQVTLINQKGCEILGDNAEEIIGKDWFETFVPANNRQDVIHGFNRLMAGEIEPIEYFENPVLTKGGQERLIAWHNALIKDDQGNIVGTLSSGEDITEQKRAEEQITNLNQDLLNRTAALEAANKDLEAFAYSVSHDLRAPLRHIDGFMELLQKRAAPALDERSRHYMDTIADSAKHMGSLIDDLLSFSRMARHQITKQHVDLGELTEEVIREFEPETVNRHIRWQVGDLPVATGDRAMLRLVLINLISNALKFTRPREQAEIEVGPLPGQTSETVIFVRDTGVGFDMNYKDKLFNVFQRLHRSDEFEGTGIGLANVRRIIARHGGRTWATGELNQGATFYFSLPLT